MSSESIPAVKRSYTRLYVLGFVLVILGVVGGTVWYCFPAGHSKMVELALDLHSGVIFTFQNNNWISCTFRNFEGHIWAFGETIATFGPQDVLLAADSKTTFTMPVQLSGPSQKVAKHCLTNSTFPVIIITPPVMIHPWDSAAFHKTRWVVHNYDLPCPAGNRLP